MADRYSGINIKGYSEMHEGAVLEMKKKTKKFILEFLEFWPLTIVIPLMLIGIVLGAALGWGG